MIELRAFGSLVLRDPNGEDIRSLLAQPKRVALLAYLAIARPRGFHRRDTLLALLWPELDEQHARWALNQALRQLRTALGKDVIASRGDSEVGMQPGQLWCDVAEFDAAIEAHEPAKALGLYRGDLLEGFHVSGCGEFERWLEEERVWLRGQAARTASALAEQKAAAGEAVAAGQWARRAFALCPDDESETRRLIQLLGRVGDHAGAVAAYEDFARRLRDEYEVEPAPETRATIAAVRTRQGAMQPVTDGPSVDLADTKEALSVSVNTLQIPRVKRRLEPWRLGVSTALLLGMGTVLWTLKPDREDPVGSNFPGTAMAVLPFSYQGSPDFAYVGEGMMDLLSADLNGVGEIRTLAPQLVQAVARRANPRASELDRARQVGAQLRAKAVVLGSVVEAGRRVRITAQLYGLPDLEAIPISASVEGEPAQLFRLVDELTSRLIAATSGGQAAGLSRLAALTTDSLAALKAYLEGERHFRAGRLDSTLLVLQHAIRIDSSFALAHYRMATAAMWRNQQAQAGEAADRALRLAHRLSGRDRRLMGALSALLHGRIREAERVYREILSRNPDDLEANYQLGELIAHHSHELGVSWLEARENLERVISLDPYHQGSLVHLSNISARERNKPRLDSLTSRILEVPLPADLESHFRAQRAIVLGDTAEFMRFITTLRKQSDDVAQPNAGLVVFTTGDLVTGRRLWRLMTDPSRSRSVRVLAHLTLAKIEIMTGRWRAAKVELDSAQALDFETGLEHRALLSLWPLLRTPRSELLDMRTALMNWRAKAEPFSEITRASDHAPAHPYLRLYLLGLLSARLEDYDATRQRAAELTRRSATAFSAPFVEQLARTLRAELARGRGRLGEAVSIIDSLSLSGPTDMGTGDSPFYAYEYERFRRAELLQAAGHDDAALRAYAALAGELFHSGAPAHLRMAQIYEQKGQVEKAIEHYGNFIELWKECDPELRPAVDEAKLRITQLRSR